MPVGPDLSALSISALYELTGRERRWIKKRLADRGVAQLKRDGRTILYPAREALDAIYDREGIDPATEQARLHQARRELAELELAEKRRELLPADQVETTWTRFASTVRAKLLAVPAKTAEELAAATEARECHAVVEAAIHEALEALADTRVEPVPEDA
jgi:phage terminase Nu1 subunit (DNA packaging protein)